MSGDDKPTKVLDLTEGLAMPMLLQRDLPLIIDDPAPLKPMSDEHRGRMTEWFESFKKRPGVAVLPTRWFDSDWFAELQGAAPLPHATVTYLAAEHDDTIREALRASAKAGGPVIAQDGDLVICVDYGLGIDRAAYAMFIREPDGTMVLVDSGTDAPDGFETYKYKGSPWPAESVGALR